MVIVHIELLVYPKVTHPELQNWTIKHSLNMVETTQQEFFLDVLTSFTVVLFILRGCTILEWEFREFPYIMLIDSSFRKELWNQNSLQVSPRLVAFNLHFWWATVLFPTIVGGVESHVCWWSPLLTCACWIPVSI